MKLKRWIQEYFLREKFRSSGLRVLSWGLDRLFGISPKAVMYFFKARKLGNPTDTVVPEETIPMVTRLIGSGIWNYSFFQFNRSFYFPYWVERQYNPRDPSFIPRSHNLLSMNQTHRNWVSISYPGLREEVSVDPAGATMIGPDYPTIEFALLRGKKLFRPQNHPGEVTIQKKSSSELVIEFHEYEIRIQATPHGAEFRVRVKKNHKHSGSKTRGIIFSLRPFNMEGPSFLHHLRLSADQRTIRSRYTLHFAEQPNSIRLSKYSTGDALRLLKDELSNNGQSAPKKKKKQDFEVWDSTGMGTAAIFWKPISEFRFTAVNPRLSSLPPSLREYEAPQKIWNEYFPALPVFRVSRKADGIKKWRRLEKAYSDSINNLLSLWDFDSITPGSYTYHEFWIRDAVIMMDALLSIGGSKAVRNILPRLQKFIQTSGYFKSQAGEWDANGQALWILGRYFRTSYDPELFRSWLPRIKKMTSWVENVTREHNGILPPGFSAEHLGVSDWYLWDNFWALGGLQEILRIPESGMPLPAEFILKCETIYEKLRDSLNQKLSGYSYYPAAIGRQKDAGMIGSVSGIYPMALPEFSDERMLETLNIIRNRFFYKGGFFQENIHSGINAYLTVEVAQGYLRLGKRKTALKIFRELMKLRSFAHTFPEAIHPVTGGGCMGDGFHGWAFAEFILFIQNLFVREEGKNFLFFSGLDRKIWNSSFEFQNLRAGSFVFHVLSEGEKVILLCDNPDDSRFLTIFVPPSHTVSGDATESTDALKVSGRKAYRCRMQSKIWISRHS